MEKKKAIVPLADGFEEIEAVTIINVLRRAGIEVVSFGTCGTIVTQPCCPQGARGIRVCADAEFDGLNAGIAARLPDAIVLPGGMKAMESFKSDARLLALIREFHAAGKIVAAICASPAALESAGILEGKHVVCHPDVVGLFPPARLRAGVRVLRDGNVITGIGAGASAEFALLIVATLLGEEAAADVAEKMRFAPPSL